jgi:PPOX class probable FMN-dependent enzyme
MSHEKSESAPKPLARLTSEADLRLYYPAASERALRKQLDHLDSHCKRFIESSPFLVLASFGADGRVDASPRGGEAGFVRCQHERRLLIPDAPGNQRLDSLSNIIQTGQIGLLFMIPGMDETLRVNGKAFVSLDPESLAVFAHLKHRPRSVIDVEVHEAYLHCAKAFMRSQLWNPQHHIDRTNFPTMGEMLRDQTGMTTVIETQEDMLKRYANDI